MVSPGRQSSAMVDRFNPLDPAVIGTILRERLEQQVPQSFPPDAFPGAGIYALYYVGDHVPEYSLLVEAYREGRNIPVYVGKAEAGNSSYGYDPDYSAPKLHGRIAKHAKSVREVENSGFGNIKASDFEVRYLSLEDAWIVLGERALLREYRPVLWNTIVNGFGSNEPGTARANARSIWDTMHPGRRRAGVLPNRSMTLAEIQVAVHRGIEISLMSEGPERHEALVQLVKGRPPVIWAPAKRSDHDMRIRVSDEERFLAEIDRIGVDEPDYRVVSASELPSEDESDSLG